LAQSTSKPADKEAQALDAKEALTDKKVKSTVNQKGLFKDIARVLQSPRCVNCHPQGDAPYQGDDKSPHKMQITRDIEKVGLSCQTCHREKTPPGKGMPPGVKNWHLPSKDMPLVFEGLSERSLCEQLKNPKTNGNKTPAELLEHVEKDALVLYGWNPGEGRSKPPLTHRAFVERFKVWIDSVQA